MNTYVSKYYDSMPLYTRADLDAALIRVSDPTVRDAVYAIWHTGLRISEYGALTADMISDTIPMITIPGRHCRTVTRNIYIDYNVWMWFRARAAAARRGHDHKQHPCYITHIPHKRYPPQQLSVRISQLIVGAAKAGELPPGTTCGLLRYLYTCRLYDAARGDLAVVQRQTGYKTVHALVLYLRPHITALAAAGEKDRETRSPGAANV